jgi:hypothetical protein
MARKTMKSKAKKVAKRSVKKAERVPAKNKNKKAKTAIVKPADAPLEDKPFHLGYVF